MILLGVDRHKSTHTATAGDPVSNQHAGSRRIETNLAAYRRLLTWGRRWPQRRWVVLRCWWVGWAVVVSGRSSGPGMACGWLPVMARSTWPPGPHDDSTADEELRTPWVIAE